jgi:lipopolysaccharide biosynthesis protein
MDRKTIRPIAMYLPQFHPIPENDTWWGKGFTEWTNVTKAKPLYSWHYQPHLPADLGYYDLRLPETREAQSEMAREHGIYGFCYYHYWFNGKRLLNRPIDDVIKLKKPDFPFMLCWANENWTRSWDGENSNILMSQEYSFEDDLIHINVLRKYLEDYRYITVEGKPVFVFYRAYLFPDLKKTISIWQNEVQKWGFKGLYTITINNFIGDKTIEDLGLDSSFFFHPDFRLFRKPNILKKIQIHLNRKGIIDCPKISHRVINYNSYINLALNHFIKTTNKIFPGVNPNWDNSARRKYEALILRGSTPELYGKWLKNTIDFYNPFSEEENFIFINAWNEWAEGNHLEPDHKWGRKYLEETKKALSGNQLI